MPTLRSLLAALAKVDVQPLTARLVRQVPLEPLVRGGVPPDFLFTSRRPNRYNCARIDCVYFSEDARTASAEREAGLAGIAARQPFTTYCCEADLTAVLDLAPDDLRCLRRRLKALGLRTADLRRPWVLVRRPTPTQLLGLAAVRNGRISAIRYPSVAALRAGFRGANVVVYKSCVRPPDSVEIIGPPSWPRQSWPVRARRR